MANRGKSASYSRVIDQQYHVSTQQYPTAQQNKGLGLEARGWAPGRPEDPVYKPANFHNTELKRDSSVDMIAGGTLALWWSRQIKRLQGREISTESSGCSHLEFCWQKKTFHTHSHGRSYRYYQMTMGRRGLVM
jgi:hypothetical protein